jgi:hypothetical protein
VSEYRAYTVGDDGHFMGFEPFICANDSEAMEQAKRLVVAGHDIELWCGARFVKRLTAPDSAGKDAVTHEVREGRMIPKPAK